MGYSLLSLNWWPLAGCLEPSTVLLFHVIPKLNSHLWPSVGQDFLVNATASWCMFHNFVPETGQRYVGCCRGLVDMLVNRVNYYNIIVQYERWHMSCLQRWFFSKLP